MKTTLLIFLIIIFCKCGREKANETSNEPVIEIDLFSEPASTIKNLSDFASEIDYIPLQTLDGSLISGHIRKIVAKDDRIYVLNKILDKDEILCFGINGKFLFKIEKSGRGPEEYPNIQDFDVSSDNKTLLILPGIIHKLLVYGISDTGFTFQRSISLKTPTPQRVSIVPESDKTFLAIPPWRGNEPTLSLMVNILGDTIQFKPNIYKYEMVRKMNFIAENEMLVYSIGDFVCFKEEFSDTVFCIDSKENTFKPRMIFDTHGTLTTPAIRGGSETVENRSTYIANVFETSRYVFYYYMSSGATVSSEPTRNRILFDKKTKATYGIEIESQLKDDLNGGPDFNIDFLNSYNSGGKLFTFVDAITLKKYVSGESFRDEQVKYPEKKNELKRLAESIDETDNPCLVILTPLD